MIFLFIFINKNNNFEYKIKNRLGLKEKMYVTC